MIELLPPGLDLAILRVLSEQDVTKENPLSRKDLQAKLNSVGIPVKERSLRLCISQMRRSGHLIGSTPGVGGGYWLISSAGDFEEFIATEYRAMITDMQETLSAMQSAARRQFGQSRQISLF